MKIARNIAAAFLALVALVFLPGCYLGDLTEDNFSTQPMRATIGYTTAIHDELISLPEPEEKIVVAVYKFRDQTGQYKTSASATTFSTAVTQGATSMLNKALEDSGWFIPIEREGLPNLLNERKIIRSSRLQYQSESGQTIEELPPMLYAGVLLEGGIVSYDTNFITGGLGVKYFGTGGSGEFRKDRITIYLRLVSVKNGQILKTVSTTKSILSKEVDFGVYRFVSVQKLLEAETGYSTNEPPSMCVLEAIEKAVHDLVIEGIQDGLWGLKNPQDINSPMIQSYLEEKNRLEKLVTLDKKGRPVAIVDADEAQPAIAPIQKIVGQITTEDIERPGTNRVEETTSQAAEKIQQKVSVVRPGASTSAMTFLQEAIGKIPPGNLDEGAPIVSEGGPTGNGDSKP